MNVISWQRLSRLISGAPGAPIVFIGLMAWQPNVHAVCFDCTRAVAYAEKAICNVEQLSKLDDQLSALYKAALALSDTPSELKLQQRAWLKQRNACVTNDCISSLQEQRIAEIRNKIGGGPIASSPAKQAVAPVAELPAEKIQSAVPPLAQETSNAAHITEPANSAPHKSLSIRAKIDLVEMHLPASESYLRGLWSCVYSRNGARNFHRYAVGGKYDSWNSDGSSHYTGTYELSRDGNVLVTRWHSAGYQNSTIESKSVIGMPTNRDLIFISDMGKTLCDFVDE